MQLCLSVVIAYTILQQRVEAFSVPDLAHRGHFSRSISTHQTRYIRCEQLKLYSISKEQEQYWKLPRLYVGTQDDMQQSIKLAAGARIPLSSDQSHYLSNVMRIFKKRKGNRRQQNQKSNVDDTNDKSASSRDCIRIFNGNDGEWLARVHSDEDDSTTNIRGKKSARSRKQTGDASLIAECILQLRTQDYKKDDRPWIMFVPLKNQQRLKNMIEKCVEMGAGQFVAVSSDRMEGGAAMNIRFDKLKMQAVEASEQCERLDVPLISTSSENDTLKDVKDIVSQWGDDMEEQSKNRTLLICRERGSSEDVNDDRPKVIPVLQALTDNRRVLFLIGPEGGWTSEEETVFDDVCAKYSGIKDAPVQCVSLGSNVLRAETASILAIGAWSLVNGE